MDWLELARTVGVTHKYKCYGIERPSFHFALRLTLQSATAMHACVEGVLEASPIEELAHIQVISIRRCVHSRVKASYLAGKMYE